MSFPRYAALILVLLAACQAFADTPARLETGWTLLDAGNNTAAASHFTTLLDSTRATPAAARGLAEALRRECRLRDNFTLFDHPGPGMAAFASGLVHREAGEFEAAVTRYRAAATAARNANDPLSAAAALLEGAECAHRDGRYTDAGEMADDVLANLPEPGSPGTVRIRLEAEVKLAGTHYLAGRLDTADSLYALLAERAQSAGLTTITCDAVNGRGTVASRRRRHDDSRRFYGEALALARDLGDRHRQAKILLNLGYDQSQARDFGGARRSLAEAQDIVNACGLERMQGRVHTGLGAIAEGEGDRDGAVRHFRDAYRAFAAAGDQGGELGARQWLGYNLMMAGHYGEAAEHYERGLAIVAERDSPQILNWILAGLALSNHRLGHLDRAEDYYLRALALNEEFGDHMSVAWCLHALGSLDVLRGDYRQAIVHIHAALDLCRGIDDMEGMGEARVALADIQYRLGDWDRALAEFEAAVTIAREHDLEELLQGAVTGLAAVCVAAGQPARARTYCEEGLAIARRWRDENATAWALVELAEQSLAVGDSTDAQQHLAEAEALLWPQGPYLLRARTRLLQARTTDESAAAVELAHQALALAEDGGLPEQEWICLTELGALRLAAGDTAGAMAAQEKAIEVIESLRRNVGSDELRRHMLRPALVPYERLIDLLAADGSAAGTRRAFAFAERSRAGILAARLRTALAGSDTATATDGERDILASIGFCQTRLQDPELPDDERVDLRRRVAELETDYLMHRLRGAGATGQPAAYAVVPPDPESLLAIPREREQVAAYFLGRETSWIFHVSGGDVTAHPLPPRARIETLVRRFLGLRESPAATPAQVTTAARRLHDLLVAPVLERGAAPEVLVIIPDGLLHRLPFAALAGPDGPLVARYRIFTAPSLQTLDYLRRREAQRREQPATSPVSVVALGCGGPDERERMHPYDGRPFPPLVHADEEAREVAGLFRGSLVLTGADAGEAALAAAPLDRAGILHLAAHGDVDDREVRRSFVLLGRSADGDDEDGLLQWSEAASLDLGSSLVTLATCRSARGVLAVGEGVTGLTQAFLFAGATCVLAAQSDVSDAFTRSFMLDFYRHLRDGETAAGALRRAQLSVVEAGGDDRARWADFVLVGDGSVVLAAVGPPMGARPLGYGAAVIAVLAIAGVSIVLRRRRA